jgi:VanZ family protein
MKDIDVILPFISAFSLLKWPTQKTSKSFRATVNCHKLNQVLASLEAHAQILALRQEKVNTSYWKLYMNVFKSVSVIFKYHE